jgi:hypothetical protein
LEFFIELTLLSPLVLLQDLKETSGLKSGFIHVTRGGWEQLSLLKDQLLESQEKLLKAYKDLTAALEGKKEKEATLTDAWKTLSSMDSKVSGRRKTPTSLERPQRR